MVKLLLATQNSGKIKEIQLLLEELQLPFVSLEEAGIPVELDVPETGQTFQENALIKAKAFAEKITLPVGKDKIWIIADDSGLEVKSLGGLPGVHSKRFIDGTSEDRRREILRRLGGHDDRSAAFVSVICAYQWPTQQIKFFEGKVSGRIAHEERGTEGFDYDYLFIPDGYDQTFAELGVKVKNTMSHRAQALMKLKEFLKNHAK